MTDTYTESGVLWVKVDGGDIYKDILDERGRVVGQRVLCRWGRYERDDQRGERGAQRSRETQNGYG